ncbi:MAG: ATP phosphoribosyltransferase regulatory subunit [Clostridia bacterium]|nr:ATP phosphoribosyltransferase regulatory subunit [Clostridia bacterium]
MNINENVLKSDERVALRLRELYRSFGYGQYKMSKFEEYDLYARNKDFLISDNVITFTDTNGKLMALKPDVTLSIVKNTKDGEGLRKVYYDENVYRISGSSRAYREIMQTGLECIGDIDDYAMTEVLMLAAESLARISADYVLDVSELDIVSAVIDGFGVDAETRAALLAAVGEKNLHTITALTVAAGVPEEKAACLRRLITLQGESVRVITALRALLAGTTAMAAVERLARIMTALEAMGYGKKVRIDFSVVDDMNYYNGIVFKGFVNGVPSGVLSGGQYDRLMRKMGKKSAAVGFAVYLDLLERLQETRQEYDVDVLALYSTDMPLDQLTARVRDIVAAGESVLMRTAVPANVRYKRVLDLREKGDC